MDPDIRAVIEAGIEAPSGENAQPWRFRVSGKTIELRHAPESDQSLYNYNNYGTLVCEGAAFENMCIQANALGYKAKTSLFPEPADPLLIATITLENKSQSVLDKELAGVIRVRTTNRKIYSKKNISPEAIIALERAAARYMPDVGFFRIVDKENINRLAEVASTNERIMLGNRKLHRFFFEHLTWTQAEDKKKKVGFYIKTLELPPPIQGLFKILRYWGVMRVLKIIGFSVLVGKGNAQTYSSSAEFGVLVINNKNKESFFTAGRSFERIWLTACQYGLSMQPLTGTIFMNFFAEAMPEGNFSNFERILLTRENNALKKSINASEAVPIIMYRIGYAQPASARATRFTLKELLIN